MRIALQWEEAARKRITEAQARKVLSDIHEQIHGTALSTPTVALYAEQWLKRKEGETTAVTLAAYKHATSEFLKALGERANQALHYVTPAMIATWRDMAAGKASARTANNKLKIVRTMFQTAWRDGVISENPAAKVPTLKIRESNRRPFTLPELKRLLEVASLEWRGMILTGLYTGQRLKDIGSLTWNNLDLGRNELSLSTSKTGRRQVLPLAAPLKAYFEGLPAGDSPTQPLFPSAHKIATRKRDTSALSQAFHELLVSASLAVKRQAKHKPTGVGRGATREQSPITFHSLRHTATSLLKNAGVSEAVARDIIGHESAEVSRHYTHIDEKSKRDAMALLPDVTK